MKNFLLGFLIGAGSILPGVSSGAFCVAFGLYEQLIYSILHFFKDAKKNLNFLIPICLGAFLGIFLFSNFLEILFNTYYIQSSYVFIGLILGTLPTIFRQCNFAKNKFTNTIAFIFSFLLGIYLIFLENNFTIVTSSNISFSFLVLAGIIMSAGIVIPGVSKTVILMLLGIYPTYLSAISNLNLNFLFPIGIGLIIGSLLYINLIKFLFEHFKSCTYSVILGFVLSSTFILFPGFSLSSPYIIGLLLFIVSGFISFIIS